MAPDTTNALIDFDFCLALSEVALNTQLRHAWHAWHRRQGHGTVRVEQGDAVLTVTTAPLTVALGTGPAASEQVTVTLRLPSGELVHLDETGRPVRQAVSEWSVTLLAELGRDEVDAQSLAAIDPVAAQAAAEVMAADPAMPTSAFAIEYVFLRLTDIDLLDPRHEIRIPEDVPPRAREAGIACLTALVAQQPGSFVLGTVVRRHARDAVPTLALTGFVLDIHRDPVVAGASTLAYLGEFAGRPLPQSPVAARERLADAWLRPGQVDGTEQSIAGTMALSKHVLVEQHLLPRFAKALGVPATQVGKLTWTFRQSAERRTSTSDLVTRTVRAGTDWTVTLRIEPGSSTIDLTGQLSAHAYYDGYTLDLGLIGPQHTEWIHSSGHRPISGTLTLGGRGAGADFHLVPTLEHTIGDLVIDLPGDPVGGATVLEGIASLLTRLGITGRTPAEQLRSAMAQQQEQIRTALDTALAGVGLDLHEGTFIPPGGGAYALSRPRFSPAGDLLLDVIYLAP